MDFTDRCISIWRWVLIVLGGLLCLDAVILLIVGKWHLGTVLPMMFGLLLLGQGLFWQKLSLFLNRHSKLKNLWRIFWLGTGIWFITLMAFFAYIAKNAHTTLTDTPVKAMLILGSGYKNGQPTPTLASRLDVGAQLAQQQPKASIILTGGIGLTETVSEASVMANYLNTTYHIPHSRMALEEKSTSTELNIKNSQPILAQYGIGLNEPIAIVTSDFHTLRAMAIAKKQGYQNVVTVGSPTPLSSRYNNWLREYFAYGSGKLLNEF